ncbi:hypothetical protein BCR33DRAFT_717869 [Rhizoclosmatium globosum]|uniref:Integrator complex subunit 7 N-terminal domain-containing protein n=1 Tax=Rhizoclosmatium globosum TaxID=329046 RepID=A0A1Y2C7X3_9FUNG|nr:hypothetical protein BCR33DRAFT_717869 [Rhizoclosmatium globosum]|eukprot:ORY43133.1 hypothetical protein BCR33DRAFT_717869 [Rhizoclosmatium globosum]
MEEYRAQTQAAALAKGLGGAYGERQKAVLEAAAWLPAVLQSAGLASLATIPLLSLADVWREADNSLRIAIYKLFCQVSPSLSPAKVNIKSIIKRVKVVMISNDPIARALTLRLYGILAHLIVDNIDIHHSIIESLESSDPLEYNAAIFATDKSAKTSMFLMEIVQKIARISAKQGPATSTKLIRILCHMHRNTSAAQEARALCIRLINQSPPIETKLVIIRSLTILSLHVPFQIPMQIQFLASYLNNDTSELIILACLDNLSSIAESASHHFQPADIKRFSTIISNYLFRTPLKTTKCLHLLKILGQTPRFAQLLFVPSSQSYVNPKTVFDEIINMKTVKGALQACEFLCMGLEEGRDEKRKSEAMEQLSHAIAVCKKPEEIEVFLHCFINVVCVGKVDEQLGKRVKGFLQMPEVAPIVSKALPLIHSRTFKIQDSVFDAPLVVTVLQSAGFLDARTSFNLLKQSLCFQSRDDSSLTPAFAKDLLFRGILSQHESGTQWDVYKLAESALIGGHFQLAKQLLEECTHTLSEATSTWLQILTHIAIAESVASDFPTSAVSLYYLAAMLMQSLVSLKTPRSFATRFIELRIASLQTPGAPSVQREAELLAKGFPDIDEQSVWYLEQLGVVEESVLDANGDTVMGSGCGGKRRLGFPRYFFVTVPRVRVECKVVGIGKKEGEDEVVVSSGARISFVVEGGVVATDGWIKRGHGSQMQFHQACLTLVPRSSYTIETNTTVAGPTFQTAIKGSHFETPCSLGLSMQDLSRIGGPGKYNLNVNTRMVDYDGRVWHTGPNLVIPVTIL